MSIKASEILAMMKRLGFRMTGYGRKDGAFIAVFTRGTKKARGKKDRQQHKLARRLRNGLFPHCRYKWSSLDNQTHSDWGRYYASVERRFYGYLCAQMDCFSGDTPEQRYMRLAIDNGKLWDKPTKCPIILYAGASEHDNELTAWSLPELECRLRKACGKLATKAGFDASCHFEYDTFMLVNNG